MPVAIEYDSNGQLTWKCVYNVCVTSEGRDQLLAQPELVAKMSAQSHTGSGRQILKRHPVLVEKISPTTLNVLRPAVAGEYKTGSALYGLCMSEEGCSILLENPDLIRKICPESLQTRVQFEMILMGTTTTFSYKSGLDWLCETDDGRSVLLEVFQNHSQLLRQIDQAALCALHPPQGQNYFHWNSSSTAQRNANTSLFYELCRQPSGQRLLLNHPDLLLNVTEEALNARRTMGAETDTSPVYWLCQSALGQQLLLKHPDLIRKIRVQTLNVLRPSRAGGGCAGRLSALYGLCASRDGLQMLWYLFQSQPNKVFGISAEVWNAQVYQPPTLSWPFLGPDASWDNLDISNSIPTVYWLFTSDVGVKILENYPHIKNQILPSTRRQILHLLQKSDMSSVFCRGPKSFGGGPGNHHGGGLLAPLSVEQREMV